MLQVSLMGLGPSMLWHGTHRALRKEGHAESSGDQATTHGPRQPTLFAHALCCVCGLVDEMGSQNEKNYLAQRTTTENKRKKVNENSNRVFVSKQSSREG
jgi:hypothetical protein